MSGLLAVKIDITLVNPNHPKVWKKNLFLSEKRKNVKSHCGTVFPPICGTLSPQLWNTCQNQILQLWKSCSTIGVQDLANHQLWNHVNSLNRKIKKIQHFGKYFLLRSPMHIKSIYTSQDFILQLDMIIILPPEVIWSKSHHPNPCYWQKTSILFHRWICSVVGYFTLGHGR